MGNKKRVLETYYLYPKPHDFTSIKCCQQSLTDHTSRTLEDCSAEKTVALEAQLKRLQQGTLVMGLDTILVVFWQRIFLLSAHVPRTKLKINGVIWGGGRGNKAS